MTDDSVSQFVIETVTTKETREVIADIIEGEAECGYLAYWREYREQLTDEQQRDYFLKIADLILKEKDV